MRLKKTLAVVAVMTVAASMAAPAALAKGRGSGGKKAIGEVATFDAASGALVVTLADGTAFAGTANEDTKVKVEHRGKHGKGKGHGNPSNGDLSNLTTGTKVLKLKTADDGLTVTKIRVRPVAVATPDAPEADEAEDEASDGDGSEDSDEAEEGDDAGDSEDEDADEGDDAGDSEDSDSGSDDEDDSGDDGLEDVVDCVVTVLEDCTP